MCQTFLRKKCKNIKFLAVGLAASKDERRKRQDEVRVIPISHKTSKRALVRKNGRQSKMKRGKVRRGEKECEFYASIFLIFFILLHYLSLPLSISKIQMLFHHRMSLAVIQRTQWFGWQHRVKTNLKNSPSQLNFRQKQENQKSHHTLERVNFLFLCLCTFRIRNVESKIVKSRVICTRKDEKGRVNKIRTYNKSWVNRLKLKKDVRYHEIYRLIKNSSDRVPMLKYRKNIIDAEQQTGGI